MSIQTNTQPTHREIGAMLFSQETEGSPAPIQTMQKIAAMVDSKYRTETDFDALLEPVGKAFTEYAPFNRTVFELRTFQMLQHLFFHLVALTGLAVMIWLVITFPSLPTIWGLVTVGIIESGLTYHSLSFARKKELMEQIIELLPTDKQYISQVMTPSTSTETA